MNQNSNKRVILFSRDEDLTRDINLKKNEKNEYGASDFLLQVESELTLDSISQGSLAVAYDLDLSGNDLTKAAIDILQLKNADHSRPLILVGNEKAVKEALKLERIENVVARTVSKPDAAKKLFITILGVSKETHCDEALKSKKSKTGLYCLIGTVVCAVGLALYFMLLGQDNTDQVIDVDRNTGTGHYDVETPIVDALQPLDLTEIAQLKARASEAYDAGRLISPKGNNALEYYQRILKIDDYDETAYTEKWRIVKQLRILLPKLIDAGELDKARDVVSRLVEVEPFNVSNSDLQEKVDTAFAAAAENVSAEQAKLKQREDGERKARKEQRLAGKIAALIESGNLAPPQVGSAYELLLTTAKQGNVRESVLTPLKIRLENRLIERMQRSLSRSKIKNAENDLKLIRNLDRNHSALSGLTSSLIKAQNKAKVVADVKPEKVQQDVPAVVDVNTNDTKNKVVRVSDSLVLIPFQILSKAKPDYPRRAYLMDIEGWVKLQYQVDETGKPINISVLNSEPKNIFNKAGIKAINRSRFAPARNSVTNEAVVSEVSTIRFNFSLGR
jgi:TonB family protein